MYDTALASLKEAIEAHTNSNYESHKESIILLLKEFARRMLLWTADIKDKGVKLDIGSGILFDVASVVTGNQAKIPEISDLAPQNEDLILSYFDKLILRAYVNWINNENELRELGYLLPNPYLPFIEIFKKGGKCLKYEYSRLEVYPFIGIVLHPIENYRVDIPFCQLID